MVKQLLGLAQLREEFFRLRSLHQRVLRFVVGRTVVLILEVALKVSAKRFLIEIVEFLALFDRCEFRVEHFLYPLRSDWVRVKGKMFNHKRFYLVFKERIT